jgi:signal transduction histidine kinase
LALEKERLQAKKAADSIQYLQEVQLLEKAKLAETAKRSYLLLAILVLILAFAIILFRSLQKSRLVNKKLTATLEELKVTQQQLIVKEKLASLGQLTAGIAHEIQNPLNFVNNFSSVSEELLDEVITDIKAINATSTPLDLTDINDTLTIIKGNLKIIAQHGKRAEGIVSNMLQHSIDTKSEAILCVVEEVVKEYFQLAWNNLKTKYPVEQFTIKWEIAENLPQTFLYKQDFGRVIIALIDNAFYSLNKKMEQRIPAYKPNLIIRINPLKNNLKFEFIDNGLGLSTATLAKLFTPFFTNKPTGEGTGLSLSISHEIIVQEHNGTLTAIGKENENAEFTILIPIKTAD